jgi:hypothetical protein
VLNSERQKRYRKRTSGKENISPSQSKRTKKVVNTVNTFHIPKARIYPWNSSGLSSHSLG